MHDALPAANYVLLVDAPAHALSNDSFATESAFAEHLKLLRELLGARCDEPRLDGAPDVARELARGNHRQLRTVSRRAHGVAFVPLHPIGTSARHFWTRHALPALREIWRESARAEVVHSGISHDLARPTLLMGVLAALARRKDSVFVVDIDNRQSARMSLDTARWSRKSYLLCKYLYDPLRAAQIRARHEPLLGGVASRAASSCATMRAGRQSVHHFYDTVHSANQVIDEAGLRARLPRPIEEPGTPAPSGIFRSVALRRTRACDRAIRAVHTAARNFRGDASSFTSSVWATRKAR